MIIGLYLQGGGAKGAFEAGALYALLKKGIKFNIVSGTSVGSVNGYYIYTNNLYKLKDLYTEDDLFDETQKSYIKNTIPNNHFIRRLADLNGINKDVQKFYVNYTHIADKQMNEIRKDLTTLTKEEAIDCINYSSSLPYVINDGREKIRFSEITDDFKSSEVMDEFNKKFQIGKFNNMNLDGGILNNEFMEPFVENKVDKLYLISVSNSFKVPKFIKDAYRPEDIILIHRDSLYSSNDSMNYNKDFLKSLFKEGYDKVLEKL